MCVCVFFWNPCEYTYVKVLVWRAWAPPLLFICSASPLPGPWPLGKHQSSGLTEEALTGSTGGLNCFHQNTDWPALLLLLLTIMPHLYPTRLIFSVFPILTPSLKRPFNLLSLALIFPLSSLQKEDFDTTTKYLTRCTETFTFLTKKQMNQYFLCVLANCYCKCQASQDC